MLGFVALLILVGWLVVVAGQISRLEGSLRGLEVRVVETGGNVQASILRDVTEARRVMESLRAEHEGRRRLEEEIRLSARRIEAVLAGTHSRGQAGENLLRDAFRQFPPGMIETNFRVNGKPVEYALVLPDRKRLPIDSKWPGADLLARLDEESDPVRREEILAEIERVVSRKAREVTHYIDPASTLPWAVAAVPDAAFAACRQAHVEAYRGNVILMPYSMAIPYLLTLYKLYLQQARSIDLENLGNYVQQLDRSLDGLERILENSVARGATMVANAYGEGKRLVAEMRGSLAYMMSAAPSGAAGAAAELAAAAVDEAAGDDKVGDAGGSFRG